MSKASYSEALSARPSKPKLRSIEIEKAENGGHVVNHRFVNSGGPGYHEPEAHVFGESEGAKLMAHLKEHLGIKAGKTENESGE